MWLFFPTYLFFINKIKKDNIFSKCLLETFMRKYLIFMVIPFLSIFAREISITSSPKGANVVIVNGNNIVSLGVTPLKLDWETVAGKAENQNSFQLKIMKEGYVSENVYISNLGKNNVFLNTQLKLNYDAIYVKKVDLMVGELFKAQRLVRSKNYSGAIKVLEGLESKHKHFSVIYELKAGAYYLNKDFKKALSLYRQAFEVNPNNLEAFKMKSYLESRFKVGEK